MRQNTVVTYTIRPEAYAEHVRLIEGVFAQLHGEHTNGVEYQVMCLDDGVSFVHVSSHDTADGVNPLSQLSAFAEFQRNSAERVATTPNPTSATAIGTYRGSLP